MSDPHSEQERRADAHYMWRPSKAAPCPFVVARQRCKADRTVCLCQKHHHVLDHGRIWLDEDSRYVLTGEPYNLGGQEVAEFITDMEAMGLTVAFTGTALWNPDHTLMVLIRAEDAS